MESSPFALAQQRRITATTSGNDVIRHNPHHPSLSSPLPLLMKSELNSYPTTFVQADTSSFKRVVQLLTGSSETLNYASNSSQPKPGNPIPPIKSSPPKSKPSKLYERRNSLNNNLRINPFVPGYSPRNAEILSPIILDFPAQVLSPVTPLVPDPFNRSPGIAVDKAAEEKAIAEKGFYLHPSPVSTPRDSEPRLLPLFPVTSPRFSSSGYIPGSC